MQNADATWVRRRSSTVRMSPASNQSKPTLWLSNVWRAAASNHKAQRDLLARKTRPLIAGRGYRFAVRRGGGCGYRRHLTHRLQRIGRGLRAIEIAAINERGARALKNNEQKKRHPFHSANANRSVMACQSLDFFSAKRDCMMSRLRGDSLSVRGYGLRTYEPARAGMQQR